MITLPNIRRRPWAHCWNRVMGLMSVWHQRGSIRIHLKSKAHLQEARCSQEQFHQATTCRANPRPQLLNHANLTHHSAIRRRVILHQGLQKRLRTARPLNMVNTVNFPRIHHLAKSIQPINRSNSSHLSGKNHPQGSQSMLPVTCHLTMRSHQLTLSSSMKAMLGWRKAVSASLRY